MQEALDERGRDGEISGTYREAEYEETEQNGGKKDRKTDQKGQQRKTDEKEHTKSQKKRYRRSERKKEERRKAQEEQEAIDPQNGEQTNQKAGKGQEAKEAKGKKRNRRGKKRNKKGNMKMAYLNMGGKWRKMGGTIRDTIKKQKVEVMMLAETQQKTGQREIRVKGYKCYTEGKGGKGRKGGGVAILVDEKLPSCEWRRDNDIPGEEGRDRKWVIIQKNENKLAAGVVYMGVETGKNMEENDKKMQALQQDIQQLENEECQIVMFGDFNGHIEKVEKRIIEREGLKIKKPHRTNRNGKKLQELGEITGMHILNEWEKATGAWTWMKGAQKTIIDYGLVNDKVKQKVMKMVTDDDGEIFTYNHDHSWIEIELKVGKEMSQEKKPWEKWDITDKSDWDKFREEIKEEIAEFRKEMKGKLEEEKDIHIVYKRMVEIMRNVGERVIGRRIGTKKGGEKTLPARVRRCRKRRNKEVKKWRSWNKEDRDEAEVNKQWKRMLKWAKKTRKKVKKDRAKTNQKWIKKSKGKSKEIWTQLNRKEKVMEIEVVMKGDMESTRIGDINNYIESYWQEMGEEEREEGVGWGRVNSTSSRYAPGEGGN